jgi:protein-tyrosine phosphatase
MRRGFIDLHCHWVADIDDGVRAPAAGVALLRGLQELGFSVVVATPHMRPGMFDNDQTSLSRAFDAMSVPLAQARAEGPLPEVHLASEHFFDDVVFERIRRGEGLPYPCFAPLTPLAPSASLASASSSASSSESITAPAPLSTANGAAANGSAANGSGSAAARPPKRGVLIELAQERFPFNAHNRFFDLHRAGFVPVLAHPERYAPVWKDLQALRPFVEAGAHLLLDVCALVGKYGRAAQKASERLLEDGAYAAACSDAHRPEDVDVVARAIKRLEELAGDDGVDELLSAGPRRILHMPVSET